MKAGEAHEMDLKRDLPPVRGVLTPDRHMADLTWLRVGGPVDVLFQPADAEDLAVAAPEFLNELRDFHGGFNHCKTWKFSVNVMGSKKPIHGVINAHDAGTLSEPFLKYDISAYVS